MKKEPAVILGAIATIITFAAEAIAGAPTWKAAVPLLVSAVIRQFVSPVGR